MKILSIYGKEPSLTEKTKPLFEAMQEGKTITSIICMRGLSNAEDPSKVFELKNFKAEDYTVDNVNEKNDYVEGTAEEIIHPNPDKRASFYMSLVKDFKI